MCGWVEVTSCDVARVLKLGGKVRWLVSLSLSPKGKNSWLNFGKAWAVLDECHLEWNSCIPTHSHKLYGTDAMEGSHLDPPPRTHTHTHSLYTYPFSCYISLSSLLLCIFIDVSKLLQFVNYVDLMVLFEKHYEKIIFVASFDLRTILLAKSVI